MCASNMCLEDFHPTRSDQRYCSPRCRQAALRERRDDAAFTEWLVTGGLDFLRNGAGGPEQTNDEEA